MEIFKIVSSGGSDVYFWYLNMDIKFNSSQQYGTEEFSLGS
jgi:hypothetical protein